MWNTFSNQLKQFLYYMTNVGTDKITVTFASGSVQVSIEIGPNSAEAAEPRRPHPGAAARRRPSHRALRRIST